MQILLDQGPFYWHGLTLIPEWISNNIHYKVCGEIIQPFRSTGEVLEWMSYSITHFTGYMVTYPC